MEIIKKSEDEYSEIINDNWEKLIEISMISQENDILESLLVKEVKVKIK